MSDLLHFLRTAWDRAGDALGRRLRRNFYLYLAAFFTLLALADFASSNLIGSMRQRAFDVMVKNRLLVAKPDPAIVIIDIDERSLATMAAEYGRWPWPRMVFAELVEKIAAQQPQAIVFDILFSDPDLFNPESDDYFNEVIAGTEQTWFPMVRLDPAHDGESELAISQVPGARPRGAGDGTATVAAIIPFLPAVQASGRVGLINIWPDSDGIARGYVVARAEHGYELPSLPLALLRAEQPLAPVPDEILLNWRGGPFTYPYISFSDLYFDLRNEQPSRPADELAGKIVIIGATAAALFDLKATAVGRQFPGVEYLATAIDNLRNGDWLRVPEVRGIYLLVTLLILWGTALAFYKHGASSKLDQIYGLSQVLLIGIAYTAINLANLYINLTGPVMFGFAYFSVARFYSFATARALDESVVARLRYGAEGAWGALLVLRFNLSTREEKPLHRLATLLQQRCRLQPSTELLSGRQMGFWRLFENTLILCWLHEGGAEGHKTKVREEIAELSAQLPEILRHAHLATALPSARLVTGRAEGPLGTGTDHDWRGLLAAALLREVGTPAETAVDHIQPNYWSSL
jgi:adenylate cyclase